ncbi:uncharacterized protein CC84DRAFT_44303 [Paraphaeosphaeria sporulosa]|uniref:Uncharacterized protein n=1 Tax=Paraphaeosphaeria sporulosa TaxID=1460663 RepID=A0A177CXF8_9PLEO|nr:uncharacterized protein CC84DRAFT_44303 [Paraphaeosphaeria sporulosa]OAG11728.1 hypothetical protein CC84DRAFT_44303 [Paraphaeosphaeria sporulosa]
MCTWDLYWGFVTSSALADASSAHAECPPPSQMQEQVSFEVSLVVVLIHICVVAGCLRYIFQTDPNPCIQVITSRNVVDALPRTVQMHRYSTG